MTLIASHPASGCIISFGVCFFENTLLLTRIKRIRYHENADLHGFLNKNIPVIQRL